MSNTKLNDLIQLVRELRDQRAGDPWIIAQDFKSMATLTIEESYELADSIDSGEINSIQDELSDLLLHLLLYADMGREKNAFTLDDLAATAIEKQKRRSVIFNADKDKHTPQHALATWEKRKQAERSSKVGNEPHSVLDGIAKQLPSMNVAYKLQTQAATVGFDWNDSAPVFEKLAEETAELKDALEQNLDQDKLHEELGDILFTVVNLARHLDIDPEAALRSGNQKFTRRFKAIESYYRDQGLDIKKATVEELDKLWDLYK